MPGTAPPKMSARPKRIELTRQRLKLSVFGEIGVGKTTLALTFPKPLVIDTDDGLISVAYASDDGFVAGDSYTPTGFEDLEALFYFIRDKVKSGDYQSVVIDDIGTLCDMLITELTEEHAKADPHGKRPKLMAHIPEQIEYLGNRNQVRTLLARLGGLGVHVCVVAGVRLTGPAQDKRDLDAAPSVAKIVGKWAHTQGELVEAVTSKSYEGEKRVLFTAPDGKRIIKSRFAEHRPYVIEPTFETLWAPVEARFAAHEAEQKKSGE